MDGVVHCDTRTTGAEGLSIQALAQPSLENLYRGSPVDCAQIERLCAEPGIASVKEWLYSRITEENLLRREQKAWLFAVPEIPHLAIWLPHHLPHYSSDPFHIIEVEDPLPQFNLGQMVGRIGALRICKQVPGASLEAHGVSASDRAQMIERVHHLRTFSFEALARLFVHLNQIKVSIGFSDLSHLVLDGDLLRPTSVHLSREHFAPFVVQDLLAVFLPLCCPRLGARRGSPPALIDHLLEGALRAGLRYGPNEVQLHEQLTLCGIDRRNHLVARLLEPLVP